MTKTSKAYLTIVALLILSACTPGTTTRNIPNYHTGSQGLELATLTNAPPLRTYEGDTFPFIVEITNKGATDVNGGVYALGVEEAIVETTSDRTGAFDLSGRNDYTPDGGLTRHTFTIKTRPFDTQTET